MSIGVVVGKAGAEDSSSGEAWRILLVQLGEVMGRAVGDTSAGMVVEAETDSLAVKTVVAVERTAEEPLETWKKDHGRTAAVLGVLVVGLRSGIGNHCLVAGVDPYLYPFDHLFLHVHLGRLFRGLLAPDPDHLHLCCRANLCLHYRGNYDLLLDVLRDSSFREDSAV